MKPLEILLYALLFVLIGLMLVSLFLVYTWFDARDRLKVVREVTREQTIHAIHHAHNKCRVLLYISLLLALAFIPLPFLLGENYSVLIYAGLVIVVDLLMLIGLRTKANKYLKSIDDYVNENEEHVREAAAQREQQREQWRREADTLNPQAKAYIHETLGDNYETWYQHDILLGRCVLANREAGLLYVQGIVIPFNEIMEVRHGRKDLKLVTSNSTYPFITIDFGALPINPETGNKYKDEIAAEIQKLIP
ncbi:MAG: hypothetical protein IKP39_00110 [Paludibacteraceae bacterium]|nr:hypothetical protein [Paludibacteraceae bacterium]